MLVFQLDGVVLCSIHATGKKNNDTGEQGQLQGQQQLLPRFSEGGNTEAAAATATFENAQNACNVTDASISQEHNFQPGPVGEVFTREMGELPVIYDDGFDVSEYLDLDSR